MPIDEKPSRNEDEYFARQDAELMRERRARLDQERSEREQRRMKCPRCDGDLEEREMQNVRIDACPNCEGVWLDKGELELLQYVRTGGAKGFLTDLLRRGGR